MRGQKAFYNGSVGKALTMKDLQNYQVKITELISANIMGLEMLGMPPPSSGAAAMILILNILSQYGIPSSVSGSLGLHRLIESLNIFSYTITEFSLMHRS
ncbi:Gamma-glutamyltransferase protein [Dioscorea alata]|uniref:Gamma-glutamyltransferase protein n=2 Tax=Dioscorea alata TaxID=55571 RepID=A0ACB7VIJ9_DIOAL|nr:Gamma-glutamyltransferase protein [Dioscorea alata]KAH7674042.1 Gamma-glutamyltransferase protein [Dioscorea alata]